VKRRELRAKGEAVSCGKEDLDKVREQSGAEGNEGTKTVNKLSRERSKNQLE
jgi:hypothetical protein